MSVDWFRIITELQRAGMSYNQQAMEVDVDSPRTIANWRSGRCEPPYSKGEKLIDIYRTVLGST